MVLETLSESADMNVCFSPPFIPTSPFVVFLDHLGTDVLWMHLLRCKEFKEPCFLVAMVLKGTRSPTKASCCSHKCKITYNATIMFVWPLKMYVHVLCTHISTIGKQSLCVNIVVRLRMQIWVCLSL